VCDALSVCDMCVRCCLAKDGLLRGEASSHEMTERGWWRRNLSMGFRDRQNRA